MARQTQFRPLARKLALYPVAVSPKAQKGDPGPSDADDAEATPLRHAMLPAQQAVKHLIAKLITSTVSEPARFETPIPPTGAIYLNVLLEGAITFRFAGGQSVAAPRFYFGGQLVRELPVAEVHGPLIIVGFQFTPTGFYRLFENDAAVLTDRMVPAGDVDERLEVHLADALGGVADVDGCATTVQGVLSERLPEVVETPLVDSAVAAIERSGGRLDSGEVAEACGVSPRHLRRVFVRVVGIPPKTYAKIVQLNQVVAALQSGEAQAMRDLALKHGYYDQAHFVRDFTRAVGTNPTAFLAAADPFLKMYLGKHADE